jgi:hypothetical protein
MMKRENINLTSLPYARIFFRQSQAMLKLITGSASYYRPFLDRHQCRILGSSECQQRFPFQLQTPLQAGESPVFHIQHMLFRSASRMDVDGRSWFSYTFRESLHGAQGNDDRFYPDNPLRFSDPPRISDE